MLRRLIAWRLQAILHGGYDRETLRRLRQLVVDQARAKPLVVKRSTRLSPGTVLTREWKGRIHRVTVETGSYVYEEKAYDSLSEIARLITGTRWSGPRLFGLEKAAKPEPRS